MSRIWVATAFLIHPDISSSRLVTFNEIIEKINHLFPINITPVMIKKHLVSWENRQRRKKQPSTGGSDYRFLFKTLDGVIPSQCNKFRLYKKQDSQFDGIEKTGNTHPDHSKIPDAYHYLIDWYQKEYFNS